MMLVSVRREQSAKTQNDCQSINRLIIQILAIYGLVSRTELDHEAKIVSSSAMGR
jgi:hypothetical protein